MNKLFKTTVLQVFLAFIFSAAITAQEYVVDTDESGIKWMGSKVVSGSHNGTLNFESGNLVLKDGLAESGEFIVDMNTLECSDLEGARAERLVGHLKSDDFFSVESFPLASLRLTGSKLKDNNTFELSGELTIKGKTEAVSFESAFKEDGNTLWYKGVMEVDRSLYDVRYGSDKFFDNLGDKAINNIFTLEYVLKLTKK